MAPHPTNKYIISISHFECFFFSGEFPSLRNQAQNSGNKNAAKANKKAKTKSKDEVYANFCVHVFFNSRSIKLLN